MRPDLPRGTVTFLFTDIEGSTALWQRDRKGMADAVHRSHELLVHQIAQYGVILCTVVGDGTPSAT